MGILYDDVVLIRPSEREGDPSVITVNCPDKTGLGCDLCRIILFFGLSIVRGGKGGYYFKILHIHNFCCVWLLRKYREAEETESLNLLFYFIFPFF
jgi:hypothetical protein